MIQAQSLSVGNTTINLSSDGSYSIGGGTATYSKSSRTLSLNNVTLTNGNITGKNLGSSDSYFYISLESDLKITNTSNQHGMRFDDCVVVIMGNGYQITINNSAITSPGWSCIDAEEGSLDIWNARLDFKGGKGVSFYGNSSSGKLYFSRVYGNLKGDEGAIKGFNSAKFDDCMLFTEGSKFVSGTGVTNASGTILESVEVRPMLMVGTRILRTVSNSSEEGVGTWNKANKTLTLGWSFTATKGYPCISNYGIDGLVIKFDAARTLKSDNANAIEIYKPTIFTGSGKLKVEAPSSLTGIYPMNADATLTFNECDFELTGGYGIDGYGASSKQTSVTIKKSKIKVTASESAMGRLKSVTLDGCCVNTAETPVFFNSSARGFTELGKTVFAKNVTIGVPSTTYDVKVLDNSITNLNATNVLVDGLTAGKISYDNSSKKLTLNGVKLVNPEGSTAFGIETLSATDIELVGDNNITSDGTGLALEGNTTISGKNLNVTSTNYRGIGMWAGGTLTIDCGTLYAKGKNYGYFANDDNGKLVLKKNATYTSDYTFEGSETAAIGRTADLTLNDMDFYTDVAYGEAGCYFDADAKAVLVNGGAKAKKVNIYKLNPEDRYGIFVGGTEVTNCNCWGVGSKYITAGGGEAVTYNSSSKILTLNGATINYGNSSVNGIKNESVDGLTIKLVGDNNILNEHSGYSYSNVPIRIGANTTITGDNLTINKLPISTYGNVKLTFLNAKKISLAGLKANTDTSNSELEVNNSNVTVNDNIFFFKNVSWPNSKLLEPLNGYYTKSDRFYTSAGASATKVVFGDKNATAIDGIEADTNAEVTGIYDAQGRKHNELQPGVNIVRMSDGTTRKIIK